MIFRPDPPILKAITRKLGDKLALSRSDCLSVAPHLAKGKCVAFGDRLSVEWIGNDLVLKPHPKKRPEPRQQDGTDDGGSFGIVFPRIMLRLSETELKRLMGGTDDGGPSRTARPPKLLR